MKPDRKKISVWVVLLLILSMSGLLSCSSVGETPARLFSGARSEVKAPNSMEVDHVRLSAETAPASIQSADADETDAQISAKASAPQQEPAQTGARQSAAAGTGSASGAADLTTSAEASETATEAATASAVRQRAAARESANPDKKATTLFPGVPQRDKLITDKEVKYYKYTAPERGVLSVSISGLQRQDMSSRLVSVYQVYYLNGVDGEKDTRLLHRMEAYTTEEENVSPNIGVPAGEYIITVTAGYYADLTAYELTLRFTPGTDYEIECNDTAARYTELFSGIRIRGSAGIPESGTDMDWYLIRMHTAGGLSLTLEHKTDELIAAAYKVSVYTNDMRELYTGISSHDVSLLESGVIGVTAGNYFICVESCFRMDGDYGLTVTKSTADIYEKETNDARDAATPLENGRGINGALTARANTADRDYFTFTLPANGRCSITLTAPATTPEEGDSEKYFRRMTLTDSTGRVIYRGLQPQTLETLQTGSLGLKAGVYYLRIDHDGLDDDHGEYLLRYEFTASTRWELEPNDLRDGATPLLEDALYSGALSDRGTDFDEDYFAFILDEERTVTLTLTHGANGTQAAVYQLLLQNEAGATLANTQGKTVIESRGGEGRTETTYTLPAGIYYLLVRTGTFSHHGIYNLLLNSEP